MSKRGIFLLKDETSGPLEEADPKDFTVNSKYDSLKVYMQGTIELTYPATTWWCPVNYPGNEGENVFELGTWSDTYETSVEHGLGYVPLYFPPVFIRAGTIGMWGQGEDPEYDRTEVPTSVVDRFGNFLPRQCGVFGWGAFLDGITTLYATTTHLYLKHAFSYPTDFYCIPGFEADPFTVDAGSTTYDYTIFYNRADEEFDLL